MYLVLGVTWASGLVLYLWNSSVQPGLRSTELVEVKFACLVIGFIVLFSALGFYGGKLTSHTFILFDLGQAGYHQQKLKLWKGNGIHFSFKKEKSNFWTFLGLDVRTN